MIKEKMKPIHPNWIIAFIVVSCAYFFWLYHTAEQRHLERQLEKKIHQGESEIRIDALTNFDWDAVCFIGSYEENWQEKGRVGNFPIRDGVNVPYFSQEFEWGLAFINAGQVVKAFEVSIPYRVQSKHLCANKASAILKETKTSYGLIYSFLDSNGK